MFEHFTQKQLEEDPYLLLLITLGSEIERENQFEYISDDIWHLDTECIQDHGDYKGIIQRLVQLSKGALMITNIEDNVDIDNDEAWVSFNLDGEHKRIELKVEDDWLDPSLFSKINHIISKFGLGKRFYYAVLGQDILVGFYNEEQIRKLNKLLKGKKILFN
ncbi:hypothetical protein D3C75_816200 [compost metagenome]